MTPWGRQNGSCLSYNIQFVLRYLFLFLSLTPLFAVEVDIDKFKTAIEWANKEYPNQYGISKYGIDYDIWITLSNSLPKWDSFKYGEYKKEIDRVFDLHLKNCEWVYDNTVKPSDEYHKIYWVSIIFRIGSYKFKKRNFDQNEMDFAKFSADLYISLKEEGSIDSVLDYHRYKVYDPPLSTIYKEQKNEGLIKKGTIAPHIIVNDRNPVHEVSKIY